MVQMLLAAGCDPNIRNSFQKTLLEEFIINAHTNSSMEAFKLLFRVTAGAHEKVRAFLCEDPDRSIVKEGDKVMIKCREDVIGRKKGKWYRGEITRDCGDGSYDVAYDNTAAEVRVPHYCISLYLWKLNRGEITH
jgi:hypothetical protein